MALITALPRATEGHLLRFPSLDVEGDHQYFLFSFSSAYHRGTDLVFFPENTDPAYVTAAKELLGEELYLRLMQSRLFDTSKPGVAGIDVPDHMVDALIKRLNNHLEATPVCEYCFRRLVLEGARTCAAHQEELFDNTARNLSQYAETPFNDIAAHVIKRLWPGGSRPTRLDLYDSLGIFRKIMSLQETIGEFLPQNRWQELIGTVDITQQERMTVQRMANSTESVVNAAYHGRLGRAREAYIRMVVLVVLRGLRQWPSFPINL